MTCVNELNLALTDWETKIILEHLEKECERLKHICASPNDEDQIADAGNEYMEVDGFMERLSVLAVRKFGKEVLNFNREPI